jgi:UDP-glucose 4-epimerase
MGTDKDKSKEMHYARGQLWSCRHMPSSTILITGGAGFIGSHVNQLLHQNNYQTVILDNLSLGSRDAILKGNFIQGDIKNPDDLKTVFENYPIDAVMHFAALTDVGASMTCPDLYYANNVIYTLNLLDAMRQYGIKTFVFSSSAAIFGLPQQPLITEDHPCHPINPYGRTKLMVEQILQDYDKAFGIKSSCLRYFNAAGGDPSGELKNYKKKESNLIPLVLKSLLSENEKLTIYGTDYPTTDGTCIRDYIHVADLSCAHLLALQRLNKTHQSANYNLGNGNGFTVRQVIQAAERVTGKKVSAVEGPRRAGDPPILVADSNKARQELGWQPAYANIDTMVLDAWNAQQVKSI